MAALEGPMGAGGGGLVGGVGGVSVGVWAGTGVDEVRPMRGNVKRGLGLLEGLGAGGGRLAPSMSPFGPIA